MKPKKNSELAAALIDAIADLVAHRVAAKVVAASKPPPMPEKVPRWLGGPKRPRGARQPRVEGEWTAEKALRASGLLTFGDPGYDEALKKYLESKRAHEAELRGKAHLRTATRLLAKLLDGVGA